MTEPYWTFGLVGMASTGPVIYIHSPDSAWGFQTPLPMTPNTTRWLGEMFFSFARKQPGWPLYELLYEKEQP